MGKEMNMEIIILGAVAAIAVILLLWRLSSGPYGSLSPSNEVTRSYTSYTVNPDSNYYTSGPADFPTAIIGIDKSVKLDNNLWKAIDATPDKMRALVENMDLQAAEKNETLQGYDILDDRGRKIGSWFSLLGIDVTIKPSKQDTFIITTPSQRRTSR